MEAVFPYRKLKSAALIHDLLPISEEKYFEKREFSAAFKIEAPLILG